MILNKPKYKAHLCIGCIRMLDEEYPYLMPREQLEITEVPIAQCDNMDLDNYNEKLRKRNPDWNF